MTIDPRLLERRKTVAEDNAHRSFWRLLWLLVTLVAAAGIVWLAFSPWFSVARVRTAGIASSDAHAILARYDVVAGTPMILLRSGDVEEALETDPWVKQARVRLRWPDEVIVQVTEREPVIWVRSAQGWSWRAVDGVAVPGPDAPDEGSPRLIVDDLEEPGIAGTGLVEGAAEFVDSLPAGLADGATLRVEEGELWATVAGYEVRLGRPIDMATKALSLTALLREDLPGDAILILVAPTHPAVDLPTPRPEDGSDTELGRSRLPVSGVDRPGNVMPQPEVEV